MDNGDDLVALVKAKQQMLAEAEVRVSELRSELDAVKRALLGPSHMAPRREPTNSTEMAVAVLDEAGKALHVNEIISGVERLFHVQVMYATLVTNISRLVKKGKVFRRVGPNRFGLRAWDEDRESRREAGALVWEEEHRDR